MTTVDYFAIWSTIWIAGAFVGMYIFLQDIDDPVVFTIIVLWPVVTFMCFLIFNLFVCWIIYLYVTGKGQNEPASRGNWVDPSYSRSPQ